MNRIKKLLEVNTSGIRLFCGDRICTNPPKEDLCNLSDTYLINTRARDNDWTLTMIHENGSILKVPHNKALENIRTNKWSLIRNK